MIFESSLVGCRAKLDTSRQETRRQTDEIGVVLRRVDSLSSTIAERQNVKIVFYEPCTIGPGEPAPAAPAATIVGDALCGSAGGGIGAVKSIEITKEVSVSTGSTTLIDSTLYNNSATTEILQTKKASETRHDNGAIIGVAIVAAVAVVGYLLLKSYLK